MLYREIMAVCSEIHTKHINTLCGQNVVLLNVKLAVHIVTTGGFDECPVLHIEHAVCVLCLGRQIAVTFTAAQQTVLAAVCKQTGYGNCLLWCLQYLQEERTVCRYETAKAPKLEIRSTAATQWTSHLWRSVETCCGTQRNTTKFRGACRVT